ncbi:MAG: sulfurtransferase [Lapillicoccus sp.]
MTRSEHLVTAAVLARELGGGSPPVVLDVRWHLSDAHGAGRERYARGHLPGARFLDLEAVLTRHTGDPRDGRHPLPDVATLEAGLGALGVDPDSRVVVYDEATSFAADRAWWVLRWAGLSARVLDGGLGAWAAHGAPFEVGAGGGWPPTTLSLTTGHLPELSADQAASWPDHGTLVDVRAGGRFRGETEPLDPRAGHIPGAVNALVAASLFTPDGAMPPDDVLRAAAGDLTSGAELAAYCGSGVSAAHTVLAMAVLDVPTALFAGSWSAWSNDPDRPVATGVAGDSAPR